MKFGQEAGFDTGAHLEMVTNLTWLNPTVDLGRFFYAYHPPLGFLMAHSITWLGLSPVESVQILNFAASLIGFFAIRQTLKICGLIDHPAAIVFLYLFGSLPIELFLAWSINLDIVIAMYASLTILFSVRLFWYEPAESQNRLWLGTTIAALIAAGLLTKFSGLLLITIPLIVAVVRPHVTKRLLLTAGLIAVSGLAIVAPYYATRYVAQTGRPFPTNLEIFDAGELEKVRADRSRHAAAFILDMFKPSPFHGAANEVVRDRDNIRLSDVWQDIWLKEKNLGPMSDSTRALGYLEETVAAFLMIAGLAGLVWHMRTDRLWDRFGLVLFGFGAVQMLAFIFYLWSQPVAGWAPTKGIYLAASLPLVAYSIARLVPVERKGRTEELLQMASVTLVAILLVIHHFMPFY